MTSDDIKHIKHLLNTYSPLEYNIFGTKEDINIVRACLSEIDNYNIIESPDNLFLDTSGLIYLVKKQDKPICIKYE